MPQAAERLAAVLARHLVDVAEGRCTITEEAIVAEPDRVTQECLAVLFTLHEDVLHREQQAGRHAALEVATAKILAALLRIMQADFAVRLPVEDGDSEIDAIYRAINMAAEQLGHTVVRRNELEAIVQSMADPLVITDRLGTVTAVNEATRALLGVSAETLLGQPFSKHTGRAVHHRWRCSRPRADASCPRWPAHSGVGEWLGVARSKWQPRRRRVRGPRSAGRPTQARGGHGARGGGPRHSARRGDTGDGAREGPPRAA
ncbi:MAG: PAS domain-containing protein [Myxococcales bacterium]|nr:PAS domain-containing protein [Myxococcales bacterium]